MTPADVALITSELGPIIKAYVEQVTAPLVARNQALEMRLLELETRPTPAPVVPERGEPGQKGDTGVGVSSVVLSADHRLIAHFSDGRMQDVGPAPKGLPGERGEKGEPGPRGLDAPPVDTEAIVAAVLARMPAPEKGDPGLPGKDGAPGLNGKDAPAVDLDALVARVAALVPAGKDGAPGLNGKDAPAGPKGDPGVGVMDAVQDRAGHLILTLSDGRTKDVGLVAGRDGLDGKDGIGKDGAPGRNGADVDMHEVKSLVLAELNAWPRPKDGAPGRDGSWENVRVDFDGERTIRLQFKDGTPVEGGEIVLPATIYRGVHEAGHTYQRGDSVTWDGHTWVAMDDTAETPGDGAKSWQLSVRRGKQGKEGKPGKDAPVPRPTNTPPLYG